MDFFHELSSEFLIQKLLPALFALIIGYIVMRLVMAGLKKLLNKSKHVDNMLISFITSAVKIALWVFIILAVLKQLGIDATSIITVFAAAGAAVALALQGSLSNLASGILIIFTKPFVHGDYIESAGIGGTVDSIDLLYTTIRTADNKIVNIPNAALTGGSITNFTKSGTRRLDIQIGVSYDSDINKAKEILIDIAKKSNYYLLDQQLSCDIVEYADSAIILQLRGWVGSPSYWAADYAVLNAIKPAFDEAGIEIPYPQMDIHKK